VHEFLGLIPSQTSYYSSTKNEKKDLDKKKLFESLKNGILENKKAVKMSLSLFSKYFNLKCNYTFRPPKIDLCDFCSKFEKLDNKTQDERKFESHLTKVREYKNTKKSFIENSDIISIKFDYNSNKVLSKLNNFERYFKSFISLYCKYSHTLKE
jgi:hypothetical protein